MKWMKILEWLYPGRCVFCDRILPWGQQETICDDCHVEEWARRKDQCRICSRPVGPQEKVCRSCLVHQIRIGGYGLFPYRGEVKASIHRFKYESQKNYGEAYGRLLYRYAGEHLVNAAALIPIPVHKSRLRERGYNQAQVMAEALSDLSGIPVVELLKRTRKTDVQNALSAVGRRKNLEGAFELLPASLPEGDLILIDDIYTSGSTVETAASVIEKEYPGRTIRFLTFAIAI